MKPQEVQIHCCTVAVSLIGGNLPDGLRGHPTPRRRDRLVAGVRCRGCPPTARQARWLRPADALTAGGRDELLLVSPTIRHLEQLADYASVGEAMVRASARRVLAVAPRVLVEGGVARVALPGEPGYED